jgi:HEAT repeat protein
MKHAQLSTRIAAAVAVWRVSGHSEKPVALLVSSLPMKDKLELKDRGNREKAIKALTTIGPAAAKAAPALLKVLDENDDEAVQSEAAEAIGMIGPPASAATPLLITRLKSFRIRLSAGKALGAMGPEAVPALIKALKDEDSVVRGYAARALGEIGPAAKDAIPALARGLRDSGDFILGNVGEQMASALGQIGTAAVPTLTEALKDRDWKVRWTAAFGLHSAGLEGKAAVPSLLVALQDDHDRVRLEAAYALVEMCQKTAEAKVVLEELLRSTDSLVRGKADDALAALQRRTVSSQK